MKYMVYYYSETGNTKLLAKEIFAAIPDNEKDIAEIREVGGSKDADVYFIGFRVNKGTVDLDVINVLSELHGKKVALFGTCGLGRNEDYYREIEDKVSVFLSEDNEYLGCYMCQGKMPMEVRARYESMMNGENRECLKRLIRNFDEALLHPDRFDLSGARAFVQEVTDFL